MPELWSTLLDEIVDRSAAQASSISSLADNRMRWAGSKVTREELMPAFVADGWAASDPRLAVLLTTPHAGFLTVRDIYPQAELERHPIYSQWLVPHDLVIALGTVIQGAGGEHVLIAVEGFKSHEASRQATAALDPLRPHLARAAAPLRSARRSSSRTRRFAPT